jgi:hypothetical protein
LKCYQMHMTARSNVIGAVHLPHYKQQLGPGADPLDPLPTPQVQARAAWPAWNWNSCFRLAPLPIQLVVYCYWLLANHVFFPLCPIFVSKKGCMHARRCIESEIRVNWTWTALPKALRSHEVKVRKRIPISRLERLTSSLRKHVTSDALYQLS